MKIINSPLIFLVGVASSSASAEELHGTREPSPRRQWVSKGWKWSPEEIEIPLPKADLLANEETGEQVQGSGIRTNNGGNGQGNSSEMMFLEATMRPERSRMATVASNVLNRLMCVFGES